MDLADPGVILGISHRGGHLIRHCLSGQHPDCGRSVAARRGRPVRRNPQSRGWTASWLGQRLAQARNEETRGEAKGRKGGEMGSDLGKGKESLKRNSRLRIAQTAFIGGRFLVLRVLSQCIRTLVRSNRW